MHSCYVGEAHGSQSNIASLRRIRRPIQVRIDNLYDNHAATSELSQNLNLRGGFMMFTDAIVPALQAAGLIGVWSTNVVAGRSVLDEGAAAILAGNPRV